MKYSFMTNVPPPVQCKLLLLVLCCVFVFVFFIIFIIPVFIGLLYHNLHFDRYFQ